MDLIESIIKITSELGLNYLDNKVEEKVSLAKKTAFGFYALNVLITALVSLFVFLAGMGLIYSLTDGPLLMSNFTASEFLISALVVSVIVALILLILYLGTKQPVKTKNTNAELIEKLLPTVEVAIMSFLDNRKNADEMESLKIKNNELEELISKLNSDV